jgi:hypothetical protein
MIIYLPRLSLFGLISAILVAVSCPLFVHGQTRQELLGLRLSPDIRAMVAEIEMRTRKNIHAEIVELSDFKLGVSYIDYDTGMAAIYIDSSLENNPKKFEAVIVHELLHLRLRVNNFPTFIFSPNVNTAKGRAIDVEQDHINDLLSIIEHKVFMSDMERFGVYRYIDLAGDTAADARKRKGDEDSQADSINYARAILEYQDPKDVSTVKNTFIANNWTRSLKEGAAIADIIAVSDPRTPKAVEAVFLRCLSILFPSPKPNITFTLSLDQSNKYFVRKEINLSRTSRKTRPRGI